MAEVTKIEQTPKSAVPVSSSGKKHEKNYKADAKLGNSDPMLGTYEHTTEHSDVYEKLGVKADDGPIDRAWARLYDAGHNAGPAIETPYMHDDTHERQYFQYAWADRDTSPGNVNLTVVFHFAPHVTYSESGL